MSKRFILLCVTLAIACGSLPAVTDAGTLLYTATLTFDNPGGYELGDLYSLGTLANYEHVGWSGGAVDDFGVNGKPVSGFEANLSWGADEFGDLDGVLWADSRGSVASISVRTTDPKYLVRIDSFDLAAFENDPSSTEAGYLVKMYANNFESLPFFAKEPPPAITRTSHILVKPTYPDGGENGYRQISLQWWDPYDIAIDNVQFSVWVVPEPATLALWGLGLAGLGMVAYRRRKARS